MMMEGRTSGLKPSRAAVRWMRRWPYGCPTQDVAVHLRLLMLIFLLFILSERPVQCCCVDEARPTSDCSFKTYSQSRGNVACRLKDYRRHMSDGCYSDDHLTNNNDEIPGPVEGLEVSYYYTQCEQTLMEVGPSQISGRCPSNCHENNGTYTAINITFKINANSASKLSALEIKLYGKAGGFHQGKTWCVLFEFGKGNVTYNDAVKHVFYYDGFVGLVPQYEYEVLVRTLPTARVEEETWVKYEIKTRSCWSPFISWHSTPFTVDFNLTLNSEGYYNKHIQEYFITVYSSDNMSSTHGNRTVKNIGAAMQKIELRCYDPGIYTVEIKVIGTCESCLPYLNETYTVPGGMPPKIINCPVNITLYTEVGGNVSVTWPSPSAISSCPNLGTIITKQSHQQGEVFKEGTSTEVRYEFWQYEADRASCSFYVHILRDTDPPVVTCSNVTLKPESPNTFNGLIEGESYTYSDSNPDLDGITYNVTKGIFGDLFPPGHTPITLHAVDTVGNNATCVFNVENTLTELPVNCPSMNRSVTTDPGKRTRTFLPNLGKTNISKSVPGYIYYGGDVTVDVTAIGRLTPGSSMPIGTHEVVVIISDDLLKKTCKGFYTVMDVHRQSPPVPVAVIVVSVLIGIALVIVLAFCTIGSCGREPGKSRLETCKEKLRHLTGKAFDDQPKSDPKLDEFFSQSSVKEGDGIDLRVLQFARSEYSSCNNINDDYTDSKVGDWIINNRQDTGDSGFERSHDVDQDHVINDVEEDGEKYHDRRVMNSQVHTVCEVHAVGYGEKQSKPGKLDSGVGASYNSQDHRHLDSDSEDDMYEGRDEISARNKQPLLHHMPLTNLGVL